MNTLKKGMNQSILSPAMGKTGQLVYEKNNSKFKPPTNPSTVRMKG